MSGRHGDKNQIGIFGRIDVLLPCSWRGGLGLMIRTAGSLLIGGGGAGGGVGWGEEGAGGGEGRIRDA